MESLARAGAGPTFASLGAPEREDELEGGVAVVSPHLDDAILSVGAAIARAARRGASVSVVTVYAGDPGADDGPGDWDARAGYASAGAAAAGRREEDRRACEAVGARPVWLPFRDRDYAPRSGDDELRAALGDALAGAGTVLLPGWPLWHEDHRQVAELSLAAAPGSARLGRYLEQPYALWGLVPPAGAVGLAERDWSRLRAGPPDRVRKWRAGSAYASQLPLLGDGLLRQLTLYEARRGGEQVVWA